MAWVGWDGVEGWLHGARLHGIAAAAAPAVDRKAWGRDAGVDAVLLLPSSALN